MKFKDPIAASVLAELTQSKIVGEGNNLIHGINEIHLVEEGDIVLWIIRSIIKRH